MADEYTVELDSESCPSVLEIEHALILTGRYEIEHSSEKELALRFASKSRRSAWPEDFTLNFNEAKILLSIHSGTRQERALVVQDVESALSKHRPIKLEDI
jgi:hypothetical protein